ncbi:MAG TPA: glutathione S-transferase N-terminal domain-containing protein [Woeseiaceae bacterium]|nr:glutathione S-transferase N-terminal domain-containing protein [Woeseiaceae bacterium]
MKLYDCEGAPSPRRVRMFAAEKGIVLERVPVDLASGEQMSAEFRRRNPECTVPVLELDDGSCISEVAAICDYLEQLQPEPPLLGAGAAARAAVLMWNAKIEQLGLASVADLFRNSVPGLRSRAVTGPADFEQIPALAERGRQRAILFFQRLDSYMDGRRFVAGERLSIADISALVCIDFARRAKLELLDSAPNLERWYAEISARPSAQA